MAYYHSLAWTQNKVALERVIQADPTCGVAHWGRALGMLEPWSSSPIWPAPCMYRAVLFTQMGDLTRALADHDRLRALDPELAARLQRMMAGDGRDEHDGLTPQYD